MSRPSRWSGNVTTRLRRVGLVVVLLLGFAVPMTIGATSASAGEQDCKSFGYACTPGYTGDNASSTWAWRYYGPPYSNTNNGNHNCTLYVAFRLAQNGMVNPGRSWGNAYEWAGNIGGGNHTPAVGAVAAWGKERGGGFGHVAYVEQVSGGNVYIRADNFSYTNGYTTAGWIPASSVDLFLHPHDLPTNAAPVGSFDAADATAPGAVRVRGWAFDPDSPGTPLHVHVYVGGPTGSGAPGYDIGATTASRPDVQQVYPQAGPNTGYEATVPAPGGSVPIYVYAIDSGGGTNPLIGSRRVQVVEPNPQGAYDGLSSPAPGLVSVNGWSFDRSSPGTRIHTHVYVGGPAGSGAPGYDIGPSWNKRPDVQAAISGAGSYTGYAATVPAPAGQVAVYAYAINVGNGQNVALGSKTVTVAQGPAAFPKAGARLSNLAKTTKVRTLRPHWSGLAGRPSAVTFDVMYRYRSTRKGAAWTSWARPRTWQGTSAHAGSLPVSGARYYQLKVRVRSTVLGAVTSGWSAATTTLVS